MQTCYDANAKKGRLSLSINQNLLDCLEPYKQQINFSAQAEQLLARMLEELENRTWVERNAEALAAHGMDISITRLAGAEFSRQGNGQILINPKFRRHSSGV
ncbi:hypothetical protein PG1C_03205 [Rugosibacter aromaticivorans]|uniref:Uncharacterized protein n=1 Tax=Rugosibacter aromaticivorans TaxID=1565605 RepID=A0A0C5J7X3_9PROT|nr:type II toxin-antitoxin system CcdA family antitoxin [Rugosibacter aromaticivorans]AJP47739.1 hypothetical protein PG1C_03205 [Rugosibacter aromaticivorans]TBR15727.1 MAG: hypothetical protein EPO43_02955 [Rugosibacter sp.]